VFDGGLENACGKCPGEPGFEECREIGCNAALQSECTVAGGYNVRDRLSDLYDRLEQLENA